VASKGDLCPDGQLELLSWLIVDSMYRRFLKDSDCSSTFSERFINESSDHLMLSVASALLMRPQLANFRFQVATALWCNYRSVYLGFKGEHVPEDFVNWFISSLFGRHVTLKEVAMWRSMDTHLLLNPV
jgi:hypothetical protein